MVLVTGGTGLVGSHLLLHLVENEPSVRAIHRKGSDLEKVKKVFSYYRDEVQPLFEKIQWVEADLTDIPALELAFTDVSFVYHCAALISFDPGDFEKMRKVNIEGTANIVNLCLSNKVGKLCYVSSIAAIGKSPLGSAATEENEWTELDANVYALSKYRSEMEVWRGAQEGLDVVMVNPGLIIGPGFWDNGSGRLFRMAAKGQRFYPPGGSGTITVHDTVRMMVLLMRSSVKNERFIAVSENLGYREILQRFSKSLGVAPPRLALKFWQLEILWRLDWLRHFLVKKGRVLTKIAVDSLRQQEFYSTEKIKGALGFEFEPLEETLHFCCARFKEENP
ncbi:NAD-dependent epimerase/dehydratase family protein [Spongiimicrobium sp. 2-473A-2-J]|uniref:NAD-dependent epimerase/dehydratase family protein n=1 Tax=Eudoraea algarum TaxID=3417568 RepID=UPI003D35E208